MSGQSWRAELSRLMVRALDEHPTDAEAARVNDILKEHADARQYYVEFMALFAHLRQHRPFSGLAIGPEETKDAACKDIVSEALGRDELAIAEEARWEAEARRKEIERAAEAALERFREQERLRLEELARRRYLARRRQLIVGAFAAAALVLVVVSAFFASRPPKRVAPRALDPPARSAPVIPPVVAFVSRVSGVHWNRTDISPTTGTNLRAGPIALDAGFLEITFHSDARVIVEAPAEVNLVDERRVRLNRGMLTAHVSEEARGFEVETPSARVTDLGTEFALAVDAAGAADVHVLSGWVAASFTAAGQDEQTRVKALYQDSAMRFDAHAGTMRSIAVDGERFARSWDDVLYEPRVEGPIRFEWSTPASLREDTAEQDDFVRLFLERTDVLLRGHTTANITTLGRYESFTGLSEPLPAGTRVDSYLLHWDPKSVSGRRKIMSGSVTFRRPILGLIVTTEQLNATDGLFGLAKTVYPKEGMGRRLESASDLQNADTVILSEDQRTLEVRLRAASLDQVRILVAAPAAEER